MSIQSEIDEEWYQLILLAKVIGLSKEDVREFLDFVKEKENNE